MTGIFVLIGMLIVVGAVMVSVFADDADFICMKNGRFLHDYDVTYDSLGRGFYYKNKICLHCKNKTKIPMSLLWVKLFHPDLLDHNE